MRRLWDRYIDTVGRASNKQLFIWTMQSFGVLILGALAFWGCSRLVDYALVRIDEGEVVSRDYDEEYDHWHPQVTSCSVRNTDGHCVSYTTTPGYWHFHAADCDIKVRGQDARTTDRVRIEERWIDIPCSTYDDYPIGSIWKR